MSTFADAAGLLEAIGVVDLRKTMPRGVGHWATRIEADVLGICTHHTGSTNQDPYKTAAYHTSPENHIRPGEGLPSICYQIFIDETGRASLTEDLASITWAQGKEDAISPGDENRHCISAAFAGDFESLGYTGHSKGPSDAAMGTWRSVVVCLAGIFKVSPRGMFGHKDFGKPTCPGTKLYGEILSNRPDRRDLKWWQLQLGVKVDGKWGPITQQALDRKQAELGMRRTRTRDVFTELTLEALESKKSQG